MPALWGLLRVRHAGNCRGNVPGSNGFIRGPGGRGGLVINEKRAAGTAPRQRGRNLRRLGLSPRQLGKSPRQALPPELELGFTPKVRKPRRHLSAGYLEAWANRLLREGVRPAAPGPAYEPPSRWIAGPVQGNRQRQAAERAAEEKAEIEKAVQEIRAGAERARALGFL